MKAVKLWLCLIVVFLPACRGFSSAALLVEEPFGTFGAINPTGHAAIYLSHVCAVTPVRLRLCGPNEFGVVLSRYHHVAGDDWLAIPLIPYLYAVDSVKEIPDSATPQTEAALRDAWRRKHLQPWNPRAFGGKNPRGNWTQLTGALYDRKIFVFEMDTSEAQDEAIVRKLNQGSNRSHFNLLFHNCADFSRSILNFYYPGSVRRSYSADLGMTTPKQISKSLVRYSDRHERTGMREFALPQVSGSIPRSKRIDGVLESVLRKKYVLPVAILHPYIALCMTFSYFTGGRFDPSKNALPLDQMHTVLALEEDRAPAGAEPPAGSPSPVSAALGRDLDGWGSGLIHPIGSAAVDLIP